MVKIINPYSGESSPLAQAMSQLGTAAFGDTLTPELKRQKLYALSRENQNTANLQGLIGSYVQNPKDSAVANSVYSALVGSGYDPKNVGEMLRINAANAYGAADPRTTNAVVGAGGAYSSTAPAFQQAQAVELQKQQMANDAQVRIAGMKPVETMTPAGPRYATVATAPGQMPLAPESNVKGGYIAQNWGKLGDLPEPEQQVLGAIPKEQKPPEMVQLQQERNRLWNAAIKLPPGDPARDQLQRQGDEVDAYIKHKLSGNQGFNVRMPDGTTVSYGGNGGMDSVTARQVMERTRANNEARSIIATIHGIVDRSPQVVGAAGNVLRMGQDAASVANTLTQAFGGKDQAAQLLARANADLAAKGINVPSLTNPDLNSVETLGTLLVYKVAEALGQTGNGVSNQDLQRVSAIAGNPSDWMTSPDRVKNTLTMLDSYLQRQQESDAQMLGGQVPQVRPYDTPQAPGAKDQSRAPFGDPLQRGPAAAPPPAPPPAQGGVAEGATATNPTTGQKIQFRNGQWVPM